MPRSPESASTGSPGTRRIRAKTSRVMPRKVGTTRARRLRMKAIMRRGPSPSSSLAGDVHPVEVVVRGRVHPVADDFLANRVETHGVGDRDPRRLLIGDDLGLGIEAGPVGLTGR